MRNGFNEAKRVHEERPRLVARWPFSFFFYCYSSLKAPALLAQLRRNDDQVPAVENLTTSSVSYLWKCPKIFQHRR